MQACCWHATLTAIGGKTWTVLSTCNHNHGGNMFVTLDITVLPVKDETNLELKGWLTNCSRSHSGIATLQALTTACLLAVQCGCGCIAWLYRVNNHLDATGMCILSFAKDTQQGGSQALQSLWYRKERTHSIINVVEPQKGCDLMQPEQLMHISKSNQCRPTLPIRILLLLGISDQEDFVLRTLILGKMDSVEGKVIHGLCFGRAGAANHPNVCQASTGLPASPSAINDRKFVQCTEAEESQLHNTPNLHMSAVSIDNEQVFAHT